MVHIVTPSQEQELAAPAAFYDQVAHPELEEPVDFFANGGIAADQEIDIPVVAHEEEQEDPATRRVNGVRNAAGAFVAVAGVYLATDGGKNVAYNVGHMGELYHAFRDIIGGKQVTLQS